MLSASWCVSGLAVLVVGLSPAGCERAFQIQGTVLDSRNRPVVGAAIDINAAPLSTFSEWSTPIHAQSNGDGCFTLAGTASAFPTRLAPLTVSAPGYKPVTAEMQSTTSKRVIVTLARKDSSEQGSVVILLLKDSEPPCPSLQVHSLMAP
jgi:Carboxypeptidase regulatory-like domain